MDEAHPPILGGMTVLCYLKEGGRLQPITVQGNFIPASWQLIYKVPGALREHVDSKINLRASSSGGNFRGVLPVPSFYKPLQILELLKNTLPNHLIIPSWEYGAKDSDRKIIITELPENREILYGVNGDGLEVFIELPGIEDQQLFYYSGNLFLARLGVAACIVAPPAGIGQGSKFGIQFKLTPRLSAPVQRHLTLASIAAVCLRQA